MISVIRDDRAYSIARRHHPWFWQEVQSPYDFPTQINSDNLEFPPPVYYWVRTDEKYYYIGYALYHSQDWARGLAKIWDEHKHDLEGVLIRTPYYLPHHEPICTYDLISVSHHELKHCFNFPDHPTFWVDAQGHAIKPMIGEDNDDEHRTILLINRGKLISFDDMNPDDIEYYKRLLNPHGVNFPDQWAHNGKYKGWMWHNCDKLFSEFEG